MPDENNSTTSAEPTSANSYVQALIGPAGDLGGDDAAESTQQSQPAATEAGTTQAAETAKTTEQASSTATPPTLDELIQQFATETGLDASDPNQRKTLKRLADKELFIRKLQLDNESMKGSAAKPAEGELITDYEKELMAESAPKPATQAKEPEKPVNGQPQPDAAAAEPSKYGDVGDAWKTPEDSLTALNEAWSKNDLTAVHNIEVARLKRSFDHVIAPSFLAYINKMVENRLQGFAEKELGDVVPEVRRNVAEKRVGESREFAIDQLRKAGAEDIDELFTVEDGPPIKFNGAEFPNTPLNRILTRHPEIMQIQAQHADAAKAERKSFIARYKLAYQIHKQGKSGVAADTAKKLVEAGRTAKDRESADRVRQSINAGSGTTGVGTDKGASKSYVTQLNTLPGEVPLSSLLS